MRSDRLRAGEVAAAAGGLALVGLLFGSWYGDGARPGADGWSALGAPVDALIVLAAVLALWLAYATATAALVSVTICAGVLTAFAGTVVLATVAWRVLVAGRDGAVALAPAWLGLAAAVALAGGGWWSIHDERTDAADSAFVPPPPRAAPPA